MKRRLRGAAAAALAPFARQGCDYVLVARRAVLDARFDRIVRDLEGAVNRVHGRGAKAGRGPVDAGARAKQAAGRRESGR
jgi:ribonuclease P protein component